MDNRDKIFKYLQKCNKQNNTPDLHSFEATIKGGKVWVECRGYEVFVEHIIFGDADEKGFENNHKWVGTLIAAANRLEALKMDLSTVSM